MLGAILGAFVFTQTQLQWLQILLGLFMVSSIFSFGLEKKEQSFQVQGWFFLPAGFVYAFLSGLIGSIGPVLNPFYLNYGLVKEKMIGTKSAHVLVVHVAIYMTICHQSKFETQRNAEVIAEVHGEMPISLVTRRSVE